MKKVKRFIPLLFLLFFTMACEGNFPIVNNLDERAANEIVVFLASHNISAQKVASSGGEIGGAGPTNLWNIVVSSEQSTEAMALLNQAGLPQRQGTNLLQLFAKAGLMSSDKEETIRFQAGLAEELTNTIRRIDGVLDAQVQISFPIEETPPGEEPPPISAAVYVKHQGILDDPNHHLETKIKRLLAGSVAGLEYDSVAVISDRSRFSTASAQSELISSSQKADDYVSLWSVVMSKESVGRFRFIFFFMIFIILSLVGLISWMGYKFYPQIFAKMKSLSKSFPGKKPPTEPE